MQLFNKRYKYIDELGQGAYGKINLAEDIKSGDQKDRFVAIKKMKIDEETGIDFTSIREIKILREIKHPNIIGLRDVFSEDNSLFLALEYMACDLGKLIDDGSIGLNHKNIVYIFHQICAGVRHLHKNWILHRDLKAANILVSLDGVVKITDFGLARYHGALNRKLTQGVVTRWYRAPEICLGATYYGESVDIWSLGCILAELYLKTPLFKGETDIDQMSKIFGIRGTPTEENWPDARTLPFYLKFTFEPRNPIDLGQIIPNAPEPVLELIDGMLQLDPGRRFTWEQIMANEFMRQTVEVSEVDFVAGLQKFKNAEIN